MGCKHRAANLARFNAERSARLIPSIAGELALCRKRKLEFRSLGLLAAYLSDRLGVHRTTLLRGAKYRALLLAHLANLPGAVDRISDSTGDPVLLQAKLAAARLEASNLRHELKQVSARLAAVGTPGVPQAAGLGRDFANLAMLLVNVLSRLDAFIAVDRKARALIDTAAKPSERVVAGPQRAAPFIGWLEENRALPDVQRLLDESPNL